jgi:hypothetical protein
MATEPPNANALSRRPDRRHIFADGNDPSDNLVAGHTRRIKGRIGSLDIRDVSTADAAGLDRDLDL